VAVAIQIILPFLGHATMVKVLRMLIVPFVVIFAVVLGFTASHAHLGAHPASYVNWQLYMVGLAFTITLSGLGWAECGNDYSRYLPVTRRKRPPSAGSSPAPSSRGADHDARAVTFTAVGTAAEWNGSNPLPHSSGRATCRLHSW